MFRIRHIKFYDHPILQNLELDFCDQSGAAVDTVLFAGENGVGKSAVLDALYRVASHTVDCRLEVELERDGDAFTLIYYRGAGTGYPLVKTPIHQDLYLSFENMAKDGYPFSGIFSDVDINFHSDAVSGVTSLTLDSHIQSQRSTSSLPTQINQLIVDIQALDDADLAYAYKNAIKEHLSLEELPVDARMSRFTQAFRRVFGSLEYDRIDNQGRNKVIYFKKNGISIPISGLSSGEKQVVYRGCFLLKDINAANGAFVFIDEPEISLHPSWQVKIMDYYKGIFTNADGEQTSQIFAATHSPFIIHNEHRRNDKVIVLARGEHGEIVVIDKPSYFRCDSVEAVQDAFSISMFQSDLPTVYLEGRTDEKYFSRALEVYGYENIPFRFRWIGHLDEYGQERNTGNTALNNAVEFLRGQKLKKPMACLYDCDTHKPTETKSCVTVMSLEKYENDRNIQIGIENALVFGKIDLTPFQTYRKATDQYGMRKEIPSFQKMKCCDYICGLAAEELTEVFIHLKEAIDRLIPVFRAGLAEAEDMLTT